MIASKLGIHVSNANFRNMPAFYATAWKSFVVLDLNIEEVKRIRPAYPNAKILVRCYPDPSWFQQDPVSWARHCAQKMIDYRSFGIEVTWANEQNLQNEGHPDGAREGFTYPPRKVYEDIRDWNFVVIKELRRLIPWARLHFPALSQGHSDDQGDGTGYVGFDILRPAVELCDVLDAHVYWVVDQPDKDYRSPWYGRRYEKLRTLFPRMPIYISECGGWSPAHPLAALMIDPWLDALPSYVEGTAFFIWDSDQANVLWILQDKAAIVDAFQCYTPGEPAPEPPAPPLPADVFKQALIAKAKTVSMMPINYDAALYKYAKAHSLGDTQSDEAYFDYEGKWYVFQWFAGALVYCEVNHWDRVEFILKAEM